MQQAIILLAFICLGIDRDGNLFGPKKNMCCPATQLVT
jgi:hypothetical protein